MKRGWGGLRGLIVAAVLAFLTALPVSDVMAQGLDCPDTELAAALDYFHLAWDVSKGRAGPPSASETQELPGTFWNRVTDEAKDDVDSLRSGSVGDNEYVRLQTRIVGPATLSFWWKVDSEENADTLEFTAVPQYSADVSDSVTEQGSREYSISGNVDWAKVWVDLTEETSYRVRWTFRKDESGRARADAGWIDHVLVRVDDADYGKIEMNQPKSMQGEGEEEDSITLSWPTLPCRYYRVWWQPSNSEIEGKKSFSEAMRAAGTEQSISVWASLYKDRNYYVTLVEPPSFTQMPQSREFNEKEGDSFALAYKAEGSGTIKYSWSFQGANDQRPKRLPITEDGREIVLADQGSTLHIDSLKEGHEGKYFLAAENKAGLEQALSVSLSVFQPPRLDGFVVREGEEREYSIVLDDSGTPSTPELSVNLGTRLRIEPEVGGSGIIEAVWMRKDPGSEEWQPWSEDEDRLLLIEQVALKHTGHYRLDVKSNWGKWQREVSVSVISPPTNLRVRALDQDCIAEGRQLEVKQFKTLTLSVEAVGTPKFTYQWFRDDSPISQNGQSQSLRVATNQVGLSWYKVQVTNTAGFLESDLFEITVHAPPKILNVVAGGEQTVSSDQQIRSQQFDPVMLEVKAEGLSPLSYRWYRDDFLIPEAQGRSLSVDE